jgi:hypothetical protein
MSAQARPPESVTPIYTLVRGEDWRAAKAVGEYHARRPTEGLEPFAVVPVNVLIDMRPRARLSIRRGWQGLP